MGYFASVTGHITPVDCDKCEKITKYIDEHGPWEYYIDGDSITIWYSENYHNSDYYELCTMMAPITKDFTIECRGEDDEIWCFMKDDTEPQGWSARNGVVVYPIGDRREFIGQIIDIFEDFLDEKGIVLKNLARDEDPNLNPEEAANIYGSDYYDLEDRIGATLDSWGIVV